MLIVDLRLLGFGLRHQRVNDLASDAWPWLNRSLAVMLVTGTGLFLSEPTKCYYSTPFWFKMSSLALAIIFTYTIHRKVVFAEEGRISPVACIDCRRRVDGALVGGRRGRTVDRVFG